MVLASVSHSDPHSASGWSEWDHADTDSTDTTDTTDTEWTRTDPETTHTETEPTGHQTEPTTSESSREVEVIFEASGTGEAYGIATDPGEFRIYVTLPYRSTSTVPADIDLLQIAVSGGDGGCRITLDGKVVAEQAPGEKAAHCVYQR